MRITRHFLYTEDDVTGEMGLLPMWVPRAAQFNASMAQGIIHDCIEHAYSDRGYYHQEVAAFGRMLLTRARGRRGSMEDFGYSFGKELADILETGTGAQDDRTGAPSKGLMCPERSARWEIKESLYRAALNSAVAAFVGRCNLRGEEAYATLGLNEEAEVREFIRGWLTYGYFDAARRYGGIRGAESIGEMFEDYRISTLGREIRKATKHFMGGEALTVNIDVHDGWSEAGVVAHRNTGADWIISRTNEWKWGN